MIFLICGSLAWLAGRHTDSGMPSSNILWSVVVIVRSYSNSASIKSLQTGFLQCTREFIFRVFVYFLCCNSIYAFLLFLSFALLYVSCQTYRSCAHSRAASLILYIAGLHIYIFLFALIHRFRFIAYQL